MEFGGVLGSDGLLGSSSDHNHSAGELPIKHGRSAATEQMLSFSTSASKLNSDGYRTHYYPYSSSSPIRTAGLGYGSTNVSSIHGAFTPSQWMELEHQALIYKYIDAGIPVPSTLLVPFRRTAAANPSPLPRSTALGWGPFHLSFSGNADPEPGRCRRSDGKKWRCSRDVVADQKYCERHVNRGRHRSRKHVEGQPGQASRPAPTVAPPRSASAVTSQQTKSWMQPKEPSPPRTDRVQMSKHRNPFGLIPAEPLGLNPLRTSYSDDDDDGFRNSASKLDEGRPQQHHPLLHFIDDWPRADEGMKSSGRTQLSVPVPSNISSSSSPPSREKPGALSPLRLSRAGWVPIPWEPTMGGPLGEALNKASSSASLNLGWDASPTGVLQKSSATLGSLSGSTGSSPRAENCNKAGGG